TSLIIDHTKDATSGDKFFYKVVAYNAPYFSSSAISDGIIIVDKVESVDPDTFLSFYQIIHIDQEKRKTVIKIPKDAFSLAITFVIWEEKDEQISSLSDLQPLKGSKREIRALNENGEIVQPLSPIEITIPYDDPDLDGEIDDLSYKIHRFENGNWVMVKDEKEEGQRNDCLNNSVSVWTSHLSLFSVLGYYSKIEGLNRENVWPYPNPYKPARGDKNITFVGLPEGCRLKIWTVSGKLIFDSEITPNAKGEYILKEADSFPSAVYIWVIRKGDTMIKGKFSITR
ncbi:MAG: hypothetical protein AB1595_01460, partial [bacterium]